MYWAIPQSNLDLITLFHRTYTSQVFFQYIEFTTADLLLVLSERVPYKT